MNSKQLLRRKLLTILWRTILMSLGGGMLLSRCSQNKENSQAQKLPYDGHPCDDTRAVIEEELAKRQNFGYVKESPIADNQCSNCNLFLPPPQENDCGRCILFEGPVQPEAYCTYWALKT